MKKGKFLKWMLLISIINIEVFTVVILLLVLIIGYEPMTLVQCFFLFWGTEIGLLMLKTLIDDKTENNIINQANYAYNLYDDTNGLEEWND